MKRILFMIIGFVIILLRVGSNVEAKEDLEIILQTGHTSSVYAVAFSPKGKYFASGSSDQSIRLWDSRTGQQIRIFQGHTRGVESVAFSPDGKHIASGSDDKTIRLWDIEAGKEAKVLKGQNSGINSIAFSPDGTRIVSCSSYGKVCLWDVETEVIIEVFNIKSTNLESIAFSPDGKRIILGADKDYSVILWDIETRKPIRTFQGHTNAVKSVAFSPDGKYIASGGFDKTTRLWDIETGTEVWFKNNQDTVWSVTFSPDGKFIASGMSNEVLLWETETGKKEKVLEGSPSYLSYILSLAFSPDGKVIAAGSDSDNIALWDIQQGRLITTIERFTHDTYSVTFSPDGKYIATNSEWSIRFWDMSTGKQIKYVEGNFWIWHHGNITFSPDGKYIAAAGRFGEAYVWFSKTGAMIGKFSGPKTYGKSELPAEVWTVAFSPDAKYIATGGYDQKIRVWDIKSGKETKVLDGHTDYVKSVAFSPDGENIVSGSDDDTIRLWDFNTGKQTAQTEFYDAESVIFSHNGRFIAAGGNGGINVWDRELGNPIMAFDVRSESISFGPDSKYIVSATSNTILLLDLNSGEQIRVFEGHIGGVSSVAFSHDGKFIASAGWDDTVKLWKAETGSLLATFVSMRNKEWVTFTKDNYYISSPQGDKYVNFRANNEVFSFQQYARLYKRPEIISRVLKDQDVEQEIAQIERETGVAVSKLSIADLPPPVVVIQYIKTDQTNLVPVDQSIEYSEITLVAEARDPKYGVEKILVEQNGEIIHEETNIRKNKHKIEAPLKLKDKHTTISIVAVSTTSVESKETIHLAYKEELLKGKSLPELVRYFFGQTKSWAVLIGINEYDKQKGWAPLPYAINDAKKMKEYLLQYLDFSEDRIITLYNATKNDILNILGDELPRKVGEGDRVVVFYSGHGWTRPTRKGQIGYIVPVDGDKKSPHTTYIPMSQINDFSELVPAKQMLFIIDACYSGIGGIIFKGNKEKETRTQVEIFIKSGGRQLLTAGTSEEQVAMSKKWDNHSVYTYFLLHGLKGEADYNKDKVISVRELQLYLETVVPEEANQHPQMFHLGTGEGQFIFYKEGDL